MSSLSRMVSILALAAAGLALAACGGGGSSSAEEKTATTPTSTATPPATTGATTTTTATKTTAGEKGLSAADVKPLDASKTYTVEFQTSEGAFTVTLDPKTSPHVAASFAHLVRKKWFDKTVFHRIIPEFLIQGGDKSGTGRGFPGYTVRDTPPANTRYTTGVVAMAKTAVQPAGTAGSQFFIITGRDLTATFRDPNHPSPQYSVVGRVTGGMKVVQKIGKLGDAATELPTKRVVVRRAILHVS